MKQALEQRLRRGFSELQLDLDDTQVHQLLDYLALIQKWTQVYNLTAVRDPQEMLTHHLLDSLAVVAPLRHQLAKCGVSGRGEADLRMLDVGSGAGLPGVVVAICCPALRVDCVDAVAKKSAFVQQVAATLKLPNLRGLHARVEKLNDKYDVVCSRAFASLADFTNWSASALEEQGVWLAMKGKYPTDEIAALSASVEVFHVEQLKVPGLDAHRCVLWLRKVPV